MDSKFVVTSKNNKSITMTIRITENVNAKLEELSKKSGHSRNELINMALIFAFENMEVID